MSQSPIDRPYVQAWLKRVERQLRGSGRISQIALTLSRKRGGEADDWSRDLRDILEGKLQPGADLIADIDQIMAKPGISNSASSDGGDSQGQLF